jgi:hypothetical protein
MTDARDILKEEIDAYRKIEQFHLSRIPARYDDGGHRQGLANEAKAVYTALENILARLEEPEWEYRCLAHRIPGMWAMKPEGHIIACPHTERRRKAGPWEEVK